MSYSSWHILFKTGAGFFSLHIVLVLLVVVKTGWRVGVLVHNS
jgi:hypothetical protein